ncbi:class II fructose-bisphosphate aldolase [Leucobacter ruminantium]|uniref:Class II fructose-bisphosphate aldolase n=1 Tax=Leucobacter ruminantium TaxID=1289170 RepID=A0A939RU06_9MICO|nr:class II fructose-bisphosphate aldolase [Leucobacter ruminantium]MBO1805115.1 class II fructose-bisphosphate aldolase [Leucobacter ruminantium]
MTLTTMSEAIGRVRAVGAFNLVQLEMAEAIVAGAEQAGCPAILQISQNAVRFHGALTPLALAALAVAERAAVPIVVHLDHATDEALIDEAIALGVPSVMYDGAHLPDEENVARTAAVAVRAHEAGVWVEAELGEVGGKDGAHAPGVRTDPEEAARFVAATGVDALAVAVGSSHAMRTREAALDEGLIRRIAESAPVPLVLHGSSGVPDAGLDGAVLAGMRKINIGTHIGAVFTRTMRERLIADPELVDPRKCVAPAREATADEVSRLLRLISLGER